MNLRLSRLDKTLPSTDQDRTPSTQFLGLYNKAMQKIEEAYGDLSTQLAAITAAQSTATGAARELARINSYPDPTNVLSGTDEAVGASITIAAHTRVYPVQGSIDVPDLAIPAPATITVEADGVTGIANATQYSIYYDDTTLADTTPSYKAVQTATNHADAQPGAAAGRHFVGVVTTPANGAGGTTGTGGGPPGGGGGQAIP